MKKVITGLLVLLCISALTGCGKDDVTLTNEDNDLVAEYIAGTLLKYSYDNEWKYQKLNSAQNGGGTISSSGIQKPSQTQSATTGHNNTIQTTKASGNSANTAAGLRYVVYAFATSLEEPTKVIAEPGGFLIAPLGEERVGDVSNVVFTNGAIARDNGDVYIYYASSDTRLHVATTTIDKLMDYVFNTPTDPLRSVKCVEQRCDFIRKNLEFLNK